MGIISAAKMTEEFSEIYQGKAAYQNFAVTNSFVSPDGVETNMKEIRKYNREEENDSKIFPGKKGSVIDANEENRSALFKEKMLLKTLADLNCRTAVCLGDSQLKADDAQKYLAELATYNKNKGLQLYAHNKKKSKKK